MVRIHIFIWNLAPTCDLDLDRKDLNFARDTLQNLRCTTTYTGKKSSKVCGLKFKHFQSFMWQKIVMKAHMDGRPHIKLIPKPHLVLGITKLLPIIKQAQLLINVIVISLTFISCMHDIWFPWFLWFILWCLGYKMLMF
jgi:hypothetical protein